MPDRSAHTREQLGCAEGLGQVIVCAEVKRLDLIALMRACRYHNHRQAGPFAQTAKDINTVHIRQAEVKDDQVRTVRGDHGHGLGTSPSLERLITV